MNFSCSLQSRLLFFYSRLIIEQVDSRGVCRDDDDDFCSAHTKQGGEGEPRNAGDEFAQPIERLRGRRRSGFMRTFELSLIARRHARYENGAFCLFPPLPFGLADLKKWIFCLDKHKAQLALRFAQSLN